MIAVSRVALGAVALLSLLFSAAADSSAASPAPLGGPVVIETRPFAIDPDGVVPFAQSPDGSFDVSMGDQIIGLYLKNAGTTALTNLSATASIAAESGVTLTKSWESFGTLPPGVPVFGSYRGSFGSSLPGKYDLTLDITADGFSGQVTRKIFVTASSVDTVADIITSRSPEGSVEVDIDQVFAGPVDDPDSFVGADIDTDLAVTMETMTMVPSSPFSGQFSEIPFQDPWWKVLGVIGKGLVSFAAGYNIADGIDKACEGKPEGVPQAAGGVGVAALAISQAATYSDLKDPFRRGEENTLPLPGELTTKETVELTATYLGLPTLGTPFSATVAWTFTRFTTGSTYQFSVVGETVTNGHSSGSRLIATDKSTYSVGEDIVITARISDGMGDPLNGASAYVTAGIDTDGNVEPESRVFLRDDGHSGDLQALDGVYTGVREIGAGDPAGSWDIYIYGWDVNDADEAEDPLVAAQTIGGLLVSAPPWTGCAVDPDATVVVEGCGAVGGVAEFAAGGPDSAAGPSNGSDPSVPYGALAGGAAAALAAVLAGGWYARRRWLR